MDSSKPAGQQKITTEAEHLQRATLCLPDFSRDVVLQLGDNGFGEALQQYYNPSESNALKRLMELKARLKTASTTDFWSVLIEELCDIVGSQCGFVAKRVLLDDENTLIEMPPLGEPGSCLLGVVFYLNDGHNNKEMYYDHKYPAYGSPCAYMKHEKVFVIPERMEEFIPNNPIAVPWQKSEAFIAVPLFTEGRCFAYLGMIWSEEGAKARRLSWSFIEILMHALEELIIQLLLNWKGIMRKRPPETYFPCRSKHLHRRNP